MTREESCSQIDEAIASFGFEGKLIEKAPYGNGHINDTFLLTYRVQDNHIKRFILQRMNREIFKNSRELMENVIGVTSYLRKQILRSGGDPERETLNFRPTVSGESYYIDSKNNSWRVCGFVEDTTCLEAVNTPNDFYQSAVAFGNFQRLLSEYPAHTLHETIANFHNTVSRFEDFKRAVNTDVCGRAKEVEAEIKFAMDREKDVAMLINMQTAGELPLRVTHNDTKLNNVLLDSKTGKAICVIDLDTVMPGLAVNDFGDSIRFGASTGLEDEQDLSKISLNLNLFDIYVKGFLEACGENLTKNEIEMMPTGAKMMTFECGIRFLADYLQGDVYFKTSRDKQNLDRCRTQFKLVADMEQKMEKMNQIIKGYAKGQEE
ncbi:MAG: mucin desulfatase [Caproiciproducens sp.]|nr:mucin desulfatase [Caproiciproducens sp.]